MPDAAQISVEEVDRVIGGRYPLLLFPRRIEERFQADIAAFRTLYIRDSTLVFALLYNLFIVVDAKLVGDVAALNTFLHLGVVTPFAILIFALVKAGDAAWTREVLAASLTVTVILCGLKVIGESHSPYVAHYLYFAIPPFIFTNVIQRVQFWYALATALLSFLFLIPAVAANPAIPPEVGFAATMLIGAASAFTLIANYYAERQFRWTYLRKLRGEVMAQDLRKTNDELDRISHVDALTGLPNRRRLEAFLARVKRESELTFEPFAVLMIDVDLFKSYNDEHGHLEGDLCLSAVAAALRDQARGATDLIGRWGGEEFCAILPRTGLRDAIRSAERLRRSVEKLRLKRDPNGTKVMTISVGVACSDMAEASTLGKVIAAADAALYDAKRKGRNRVSPPFVSSDLKAVPGSPEPAVAQATSRV